ncbi:WxL domain-containing protein [Cytobacillus purgationiresistens]|uniref:WxL domain-containing protein n=1 Tax=Cytobacillus purgationiresistens TaxID=863449 RepID=A0ABU0AMH6_9BACI|nr:WxL domain-containing protein [Cytobacillus purgationiresistens]MDQ0271250.1 hypothetical protein [Cytobacillus purgationiresistens]
MKLNKKLGAAVLSIGLVSSVFFGSSAFAAPTGDTHVIQKINAGTRDVSVTTSTTFNDITLNGEIQKTNADPGVLTFVDASGTGEGYRINASSTQFKTVAPPGGYAAQTSAKTLPKGSLLLKNNGADISTVGGSTSQLPTWHGGSWVLDTDSEVTIMKANKDQGMGKYSIDFGSDNLELTLNPSTTYVDKINYQGVSTPYETTITYTIVSGP